MRGNTHYYKSYAIKNMEKTLKLDRRVFHIIPDCGRSGSDPVDATLTLRSAKHLIDVWQEAKECACGCIPLPHHYQCIECVTRRLSGTRRLRLIRRAR